MSVLMVTGSREKYWRDKTLVKCAITNRLSTYPLDTVVVQGGADGVDCWTKIACEIVGLECRTFYPRTDLPSPHRFHERNDRMLGLTCRADDRIYRIPLNCDPRVRQHLAGKFLHPCPPRYARDSYGWTWRERLDPMALGTCRYCDQRLPTSPTPEVTSSDALSGCC